MKTKGNGGYQIIDFEGQAPNTLDVDFFDSAIARGKPLWVNNLVVNGETYQGVASAKKTLTHLVLVLAVITITIALADGSTTYAEIGGDCNNVVIDCSSMTSTTLSETQLDEIEEAIENGKSVDILINVYYDSKDEVVTYGDDVVHSPLICKYNNHSYQYIEVNDLGIYTYVINATTGAISLLGFISY